MAENNYAYITRDLKDEETEIDADLLGHFQEGIVQAHQRIDALPDAPSITIDKELDTDGAAADAKAVGDKLIELSNKLAQLDNQINYKMISGSVKIKKTYEGDTENLILEKGDSLFTPTLKWEISKEAESIQLYGFSNDDDDYDEEPITLDTYIEVDGEKTPILNGEFKDRRTLKSDHTWKLVIKEANGKNGVQQTIRPTASVSFYNRIYWGVGTQASGFTADFIKKLTDDNKANCTELTKDGKTKFTVHANDKKYVYFAIPAVVDKGSTEEESKLLFYMVGNPYAGGMGDSYRETVGVEIKGFAYVYHVYRSDQRLSGDIEVIVR
jgi:hypothetical protein